MHQAASRGGVSDPRGTNAACDNHIALYYSHARTEWWTTTLEKTYSSIQVSIMRRKGWDTTCAPQGPPRIGFEFLVEQGNRPRETICSSTEVGDERGYPPVFPTSEYSTGTGCGRTPTPTPTPASTLSNASHMSPGLTHIDGAELTTGGFEQASRQNGGQRGYHKAL